MKLGTAFTISAATFVQYEGGIITAAAIGMKTSSTTSKKKFSSLISFSKQSFQNYQNAPYHRHLEQEEATCETTLLGCISNTECAACFHNMGEKDVDFTTLAHGTDCDEVIQPLVDKDVCSKDLQSDKDGKAAFCRTIETCAVSSNNDDYYDEDNEDYDDDNNDDVKINCDELTSCDWDGFKQGLIGDGACHENYQGCYNTAICGYDGGDCCEDTCVNQEENLLQCGSDGYFCRDPESPNCETCPTDDKEGGDKPERKRCGDDEQGLLLIKYASFGNGWGSASMTIDRKGSNKKGTFYEGTMDNGASDQELICLPKEADCYDVQITGGNWGNRVSWQIKPVMEGAPEIASGGAPLKCQFPVGGDVCEDTCMGQSDEEKSAITDDEDYDSYEEMAECIDEKCLIQLASCELNYSCMLCMVDDAPAYCYVDDNFNAIVQCATCQCVPDLEDEDGFDEYCESMGKKGNADKQTGQMPECTAEQSRQGVNAAFNYTICSTVDFASVINTDYDNDHFGRLDAFENCATTYTNEAYHGGKTALDCMRILQTAINSPTDGSDPTDPVNAISILAYDLYTNGENFCDCSAQASEECPLCDGFKNFKTILYESVDACRALDQIDCAAWSEFSTPCMLNMEAKFGNSAFTSEIQCQYVHDGCGNAGPFPSFRHLDCDSEIDDKKAWDFYQSFASGCLKSTNGGEPDYPGRNVPKPNPVSPPTKKTSATKTSAPTRRYVPLNPVDDNDDDNSGNDSGNDSSKTEEKKSGGFLKGFLKFCLFGIVCGAGYWYYKRTREFDYVRFRRARNYGADGPMIDSSAMENSAMSFEPPSLPPPPSSYEMNSNFA